MALKCFTLRFSILSCQSLPFRQRACENLLQNRSRSQRNLSSSCSRHNEYSKNTSTPSEGAITAAPPIDVDSAFPPISSKTARLVPASPSYFSTTPRQLDDLVEMQTLMSKHSILPLVPPSEAPRVLWKTPVQYRLLIGEDVSPSRYRMIYNVVERMNRILPVLVPPEVRAAIEMHKREGDPFANRRRPAPVDEWGRGYGVGRRKSSSAQAWVVLGDGQVLVNGMKLNQVWGRVHDRESAVWALVATGRVGKYNVWAKVRGGGTTGQAEAVALAVSRALEALEPALKPALRRAGVIRRDPRKVERKKPGKLKARKMPAWVKR